jgi:endonuclease G
MQTAAAAIVLLLAVSWGTACSPIQNSTGDEELSVTFKNDLTEATVEYIDMDIALSVRSDMPWNVVVAYENESLTGQWCNVATPTGEGNGKVNISVEENGGAERSAVFTLYFGSEKRNVRLTQRAFHEQATNWKELPAVDGNGTDNTVLVSHYIDVENDIYSTRNMRNFTICYDTEEHYPLWVAYPMHKSYYPGGARTDAWGYDPKIDRELQPNMSRGIEDYTRGHMLGSASRTMSEAVNEQTFYFTNMTAQSSGFNSLETAWTLLEGHERGWGGTGSDTLYCVSGAVLKTVDGIVFEGITGGQESVKHTSGRNDDKPIAVPNYFYKAMVKQFASGTNRGIAFWFKHENTYRDVEEADMITIDELERRTGLDLFPGLPDDIEAQVESEREPSLWPL